MNLKEQREAAYKAAQEIIDGAKGRDLTDEEVADLEAKTAEVKSLDEKIAAQAKGAELIATVTGLEGVKSSPVVEKVNEKALTLGEHFAKEVGPKLKERNGRFSFGTTEFKANTDTQVTGGTAGVFGPYLTDLDRNIVTGYRRRPVIADLLGSGRLNGSAIRYLVEGAREGNFSTVAEAGQKPQIHYADPTAVVESLKKIAGFIKLSDEMIDDLEFVVSEINNRLLYDLSIFEEAQLLSGDGTGQNLSGILNRAIGTETAADVDDNADAIFRAITDIQVATGLNPDGLVINPTDYQSLRLSKDANGQYFGGGFFQGQYGEGSIAWEQPVWGLRTVVTPAIAQGSALVGAFAQSATVYRKGGVSVESTNSHEDDFTNNLVTVRAEERLALAVRRPLGFVNVTLAEAAS